MIRLEINFQELNKSLKDREIKFDEDQIYTISSEKYNLICLKCGYRWRASFGSVVYDNRGCYKCGNIKIGDIKRLKLNTEIINERIKNRNFELITGQEINIIVLEQNYYGIVSIVIIFGKRDMIILFIIIVVVPIVWL